MAFAILHLCTPAIRFFEHDLMQCIARRPVLHGVGARLLRGGPTYGVPHNSPPTSPSGSFAALKACQFSAHGHELDESSPPSIPYEPVVYRKRLEEAGEDDELYEAPLVLKEKPLVVLKKRSKWPDWQKRLDTGIDYKYESGFRDEPSRGPRLVELYPNDWSLWMELLAFQERHHGFHGLYAIWQKLQAMRLDLPTEGEIADEIWSCFLRMIKNQDSFLVELIEYVARLRDRTGRVWSQFYVGVMQRKLRYKSRQPVQWHQQLVKVIEPRRKDYERLFAQAQQTGALEEFERIYLDYPIRGLYSIIVPKMYTYNKHKLSRTQRANDAFKWHFLLLEHNDLPTSFDDVKSLLGIFKGMKDQKPYNDLLVSIRGRAKQIFARTQVEQTPPSATPARSSLSAHLCARLVATRVLPVEAVINGLEMFGVRFIDAATLREMVFRSNFNLRILGDHMKHLEINGIAISSSKYCKIIVEAVRTNQLWLLRSITESDAHPDTFDDYKLQEQLLTMYWAQGDMNAVEMTMSVLLWGKTAEIKMWERKNLLLRVHLRLKQDTEVRRSLDDIMANNNSLSSQSAALFRSSYLTPRVTGSGLLRQHMLENLLIVIQVLRYSLETSRDVPIESWREPLRRLGMFGMLGQFRRLALWLANWYSNPPIRPYTLVSVWDDLERLQADLESQQPTRLRDLASSGGQEGPSLFTNNMTPEPGLSLAQTAKTKGIFLSFNPWISALEPIQKATNSSPDIETPKVVDTSSSSPLELLFTPLAQRGILVWGFQQSITQPIGRRRAHFSGSLDPGNNWSWGLKLLKDLRNIGVPVSDDLIRRQCNRQMSVLFSNTIQLQKRNRRLRVWHDQKYARATLTEDGLQNLYQMYARKMAAIWGQEVIYSTRYMPLRWVDWSRPARTFRRLVRNEKGEVRRRNLIGMPLRRARMSGQAGLTRRQLRNGRAKTRH